jgi:hypothetical protein
VLRVHLVAGRSADHAVVVVRGVERRRDRAFVDARVVARLQEGDEFLVADREHVDRDEGRVAGARVVVPDVILQADPDQVALGIAGRRPAQVVEKLDAARHHARRVGRGVVLGRQRIVDHRRTGLERGLEDARLKRGPRLEVERHAPLEHPRILAGLGQDQGFRVP